MIHSGIIRLIILYSLVLLAQSHKLDAQSKIEKAFSGSSHTNNWAVLVCTSRFWFNYRHIANVLSIYRSVKRLGVPDSQIIMMLADDMACNPRNPRPGEVHNNKNSDIDVYGTDVEVDYRGYEVTVENFIRVLTGRLPPDTPRSKRLNTDDRSNVLVYMTGHGGEDFLKFQDAEEISNVELGDAFAQMWQKRRYNELLFIIDTCQAASMYSTFHSPNIISIASSQVGEDSLSHHVDPAIGVFIIDRYTYHLLDFLERVTPASRNTMKQLFDVCPKHQCISTTSVSTTSFNRDPGRTLISDFFGSVRRLHMSDQFFPLVPVSPKAAEHTGSQAERRRYSNVEQFPTLVADRRTAHEQPHQLAVTFLSSVLLLVFCCFTMQSLLRD